MESEKVAIYEGAKACAGLFNDCIAHPGLNGDNWASDQAGSFKLWIEYVGAFTRYSASADARLNTNLDVKEAVIGLLDLLQLALRKTLQTIRPAPNSLRSGRRRSEIADSPIDNDEESLGFLDDETANPSDVAESSSTESSTSISSQPTRDVEDLLMRLHQIAIAIRTSSSQRASVKAAAFRYKDEEEFAQFMTWYMNNIFRRNYPDVDEFLIARLRDANLQRRRQFEYNRQHSRKLAQDRQVLETRRKSVLQTHRKSLSLQPPPSEARTRRSHATTSPNEPGDLDRTSLALSSTIFSAPVVSQNSKSPAPGSGRSGKTFITSHIKWPRPPDASQNVVTMFSFSCPYCCKPLPIDVRDNRKHWREHVKTDMQPYICLFEDCQNAHQLYSNRQEWLKHMRHKHGRVQYVCHAGVHQRGPRYFDKPDAYEEHMLREHVESFNKHQLPMLVEKSTYRTPLDPVFQACPICPGPDIPLHGNVSTSLADTELSNTRVHKRSRIEGDQSSSHNSGTPVIGDDTHRSDEHSGEDQGQRLVMHVMEHLQFIALLSLPWDAEQESGGSKTSQGKTDSEGESTDSLAEDDQFAVLGEGSIRPLSPPPDFPHDPAFVSNQPTDLRHKEWDFVSTYSSRDGTKLDDKDPVLESFLARLMQEPLTLSKVWSSNLPGFLEDERRYNGELMLIRRDMHINPELFPPESFQTIFRNISHILSNSDDLLQISGPSSARSRTLNYKQHPDTLPMLEDLLPKLISHFSHTAYIYRIFANGQSAASREMRSPAVVEWAAASDWTEYEERATPGEYVIANLERLLLRPLKRMNEYCTFLQDLALALPSEDSLKKDIDEIVGTFRGTSTKTSERGTRAHRMQLLTQFIHLVSQASNLPRAIRNPKLQTSERANVYNDEYSELMVRFDNNIIHAMVVGSDFSSFGQNLSKSVSRLVEIAKGFEALLFTQTNHVELESKWQQIIQAVQDLSLKLPDYLDQLNTRILTPIQTVVDQLNAFKLRPDSLCSLRNKYLDGYVIALIRRTPGREIMPSKTEEFIQGWEALDAEVKDCMRRLIAATGSVIRDCQWRLIALWQSWLQMYREKLSALPIYGSYSDDTMEAWKLEFDFQDAWVQSLGICNGTLLSERLSSAPAAQPAAHAPTQDHSAYSGISGQSFDPFSRPLPRTDSSFTPTDGRRVQSITVENDGPDSPVEHTVHDPSATHHSDYPTADAKVLFQAASVYEFSIDRSRREAGFPYLTYAVGECFDVIGERGELWLAINQDDPTRQVGWLWNRHFLKLET